MTHEDGNNRQGFRAALYREPRGNPWYFVLLAAGLSSAVYSLLFSPPRNVGDSILIFALVGAVSLAASELLPRNRVKLAGTLRLAAMAFMLIFMVLSTIDIILSAI